MLRSFARLSSSSVSSLRNNAILPTIYYSAFNSSLYSHSSAPLSFNTYRGFVSSSVGVNANSTSLSVTSSPAPPALAKTKNELIRSLEEETNELSSAPDETLLDYIKEKKMKIVEKEGNIKIHRVVGDYELVFSFDAESDDNPDNDSQSPDNEEHDQQNEAQGESDEDEVKLPQHSWELEINNKSASENNYMKITAYSDKEGLLAIESIDFTQPKTPTAENLSFDYNVPTATPLYFDDLGENAQDQLLEFMRNLDIDDTMALFIKHYAQVSRTQQHVEKIKSFKLFLEA